MLSWQYQLHYSFVSLFSTAGRYCGQLASLEIFRTHHILVIFGQANGVARQFASELHIFPGLRGYFLARCGHHESMGFSRLFCRDVNERRGIPVGVPEIGVSVYI